MQLVNVVPASLVTLANVCYNPLDCMHQQQQVAFINQQAPLAVMNPQPMAFVNQQQPNVFGSPHMQAQHPQASNLYSQYSAEFFSAPPAAAAAAAAASTPHSNLCYNHAEGLHKKDCVNEGEIGFYAADYCAAHWNKPPREWVEFSDAKGHTANVGQIMSFTSKQACEQAFSTLVDLCYDVWDAGVWMAHGVSLSVNFCRWD